MRTYGRNFARTLLAVLATAGHWHSRRASPMGLRYHRAFWRAMAPTRFQGDEMARRRGFFADLQHQSQLTAKRNAQQQAAFHRAQVRAAAEAQRALRDAERAQAQAVRFATLDAKAAEAERKAAEAKALRLHREARLAEVDALNAELASVKDQIDSILAATLTVDDSVRPATRTTPFEGT